MIGAGMGIFFAGCRHRVAPVERGVDSIVINTTERLIQGDSLSPACDLRINLAYATPDDSINRLINEAVAHAAFDYTGVTLPAAATRSPTATSPATTRSWSLSTRKRSARESRRMVQLRI